MSVITGTECKLLRATHLLQGNLDKKNELSKHLSEPLDEILTDEDRTLLRNFLASKDLKNILTQISLLSRITQYSSKSSSDKSFATLHPLISKLRPHRPEDRNCLVALNKTWSEIESLLTRAAEGRYPEAQELYDILSNDSIRELLVAVHDTGNFSYTTHIDQNSVTTPVYVERDPVFMKGEDEEVDCKDSLDRPFFMSSPPLDDEPPTIRQSLRDRGIKHPSKGSQQLYLPSNLSPLSTTQEFSQTLSSASFATPHHHQSSISESSCKSAKNHFPYHSLGRRVGGANLKHPALPSNVESSLPEPGMLRTVYINRKSPEEPLGITLSTYSSSQTPTRSASLLSLLGRQTQREANKDPPKIIINRIIVGSLADKEGKLFPGDELIELNGVAATSLETVQKVVASATQKNVLQMIVKTPGIGQLKAHILSHNNSEEKVYIRCLFKYDPLKDTLLPSANLGVAFKSGDVLELVDSQDLNWWQVRRLDTPNLPVGLVPSQTLQERRQAFNQQASGSNINKKIKRIKSIFRAADSSNLLVRSDLWVYEEVVPWPPSPVHTLLLIGPNGVGRRTIKFLLCTQFPQRFSFPVSDTTDSTATPALFHIRTKEDMESDIRRGAYVEWGTVDGHHYGIRFSAIREIIASGRTALVDCQCQSVHLLHQPEFNPHVVFVSAPKFETAKAMMDVGIRENLTVNKRTDEEVRKVVEESKMFAIRNQHLYTHTLVNNNMAESVEKLLQLVLRLEKQPGWIPASWAYELSLPNSFGKDGKYKHRLPCLSILSGLGISGLSEDNRSVLSRVTSSILSVASPESAVRLARPPSVCSSLQLPGMASKRNWGSAAGSRWRYEKRGAMQSTEPPLSSLCSSADSETGGSNSALPAYLSNGRNLISKAAVPDIRPTFCGSESSKPSEPINQQICLTNATKSSVLLNSIRKDAKATDGGDDDDDDAISNTSSEDE
uniref:MAGUK p55 subfamily n=1 Tax=Echinococcus granulosus TaxID=6210 RepID=A0A068WA20_ECHGR|nr:MAGUK p55 subfamily [Echinococcus granulosus]